MAPHSASKYVGYSYADNDEPGKDRVFAFCYGLFSCFSKIVSNSLFTMFSLQRTSECLFEHLNDGYVHAAAILNDPHAHNCLFGSVSMLQLH